ncbi:hypothetical protein FRB94_001514 [Tulasnella sp. JGI-2019a]|nr:hypothetical protein FRB94_001514 [Tulasnella sp. JGI-2019a]
MSLRQVEILRTQGPVNNLVAHMPMIAHISPEVLEMILQNLSSCPTSLRHVATCSHQFQQEAERVLYASVALSSSQPLCEVFLSSLRAQGQGQIRCKIVRELDLSMDLTSEMLHQVLLLTQNIHRLKIRGSWPGDLTRIHLLPKDAAYSFQLTHFVMMYTAAGAVDLVAFLASQATIFDLDLPYNPSQIQGAWASCPKNILPNLAVASLSIDIATVLLPGRSVRDLCVLYQASRSEDLAKAIAAAKAPIRELSLHTDTLTAAGLSVMSSSLCELATLRLFDIKGAPSLVQTYDWLAGLTEYRKLEELFLGLWSPLTPRRVMNAMGRYHGNCPTLTRLVVHLVDEEMRTGEDPTLYEYDESLKTWVYYEYDEDVGGWMSVYY